MRSCAVVLALLVQSIAAYADDPSPPAIATAIKSASEAHKPLLVEFHAEWCMPCKLFAEKTLPEPRVQEALKDVLFVGYDAEDGPGLEAAKKYNIASYPTFVVIDKQGVERYRYEGAPVGQTGVDTMIELISNARIAVMDEDDVRSTIKNAPDDAKVRLTAASWFLNRKMRSDAQAQYEAVSTNKSATSAQRMEATTALIRIRRLEFWKRQLLGEKFALIEASPGDVAEGDVAIALLGSDISKDEARKLIRKIIEAQTDIENLNGLVYVALTLGETDEALAAANHIVAKSRTWAYLDTLAECFYVKGDRKKAVELEDEALTLVKKDTADQATLRYNRRRFDKGSGHSNEVKQLPLRVSQFWAQMEYVDQLPGDVRSADGMDPWMKDEMQRVMNFRKATQDLETAISKACVKDAGSVKQAMARLDKLGDGHIAFSVLLLEPNTSNALRDCVSNQLSAALLPKYQPHDAPVLTFNFAK